MEKHNTKEKVRQYTPWHFYFGYALKQFISKKDMEILTFEKLGTLPLEADVIIIKKKNTKDLSRKYHDLKFFLPYLGKCTVIEYKSPLDRLTYEDFDTVRAYLCLAKRKYSIKYDRDINIIFICSAFENDYFKYVKDNGYRCNKIDDGIYGHESELGSDIYWINLKEIGEKDPGNVFKLFSISVKDYNNNKPIAEIRNIKLLKILVSQIFSKKEETMKGLHLRQREEFDNTMESFKAMFLSNLSAKERIHGLGLEERLQGLGPEEIITVMEKEPVRAVFLNRLSPEERLKGLGTEERLKGLGPEERLKGLGPEERLKGLGPEERLKGLDPEDMKKIREYLDKTS